MYQESIAVERIGHSTTTLSVEHHTILRIVLLNSRLQSVQPWYCQAHIQIVRCLFLLHTIPGFLTPNLNTTISTNFNAFYSTTTLVPNPNIFCFTETSAFPFVSTCSTECSSAFSVLLRCHSLTYSSKFSRSACVELLIASANFGSVFIFSPMIILASSYIAWRGKTYKPPKTPLYSSPLPHWDSR